MRHCSQRKPKNNRLPTIETKKKNNVVKRDANRSKGEVELNLPSEATEADARAPPVQSRLPRSTKRSLLAPNSSSNLATDELSNSLPIPSHPRAQSRS
ncbi:hypothetical protein VP01_4430g1 [Puccinia sorghi]|uniref:Uncharacterized protein n=1 Tax=Puccinia sorghi TaxID=27349 RepID=A0A0L6UPH0_9BASI|nr:hypothetical protein VP01_4430g1 [Puccinia sorghi]